MRRELLATVRIIALTWRIAIEHEASHRMTTARWGSARLGMERRQSSQQPQTLDIRHVGAFLVEAGDFEDHRHVGEGGMTQQALEGLRTDVSFADVLVAIDLGAQRRLRVIHVDRAQPLETD